MINSTNQKSTWSYNDQEGTLTINLNITRPQIEDFSKALMASIYAIQESNEVSATKMAEERTHMMFLIQLLKSIGWTDEKLYDLGIFL